VKHHTLDASQCEWQWQQLGAVANTALITYEGLTLNGNSRISGVIFTNTVAFDARYSSVISSRQVYIGNRCVSNVASMTHLNAFF